MALPNPEPGLVLSYSYLWRYEQQGGAEEGVKDRPCAVALVIEEDDTDTVVWVAPITHIVPTDQSIAVEIPLRVKEHLGLDGERSWIIVNEVNIFHWPGPDLRHVPGSKGRIDYGFLPPKLFNRVRQKMLANARNRGLVSVKRTV